MEPPEPLERRSTQKGPVPRAGAAPEGQVGGFRILCVVVSGAWWKSERTKTQALLPSQDAVLLLLFGLLRSGQIRLRRLDGWRELPPVQLSPPEAA